MPLSAIDIQFTSSSTPSSRPLNSVKYDAVVQRCDESTFFEVSLKLIRKHSLRPWSDAGRQYNRDILLLRCHLRGYGQVTLLGLVALPIRCRCDSNRIWANHRFGPKYRNSLTQTVSARFLIIYSGGTTKQQLQVIYNAENWSNLG